MVKWTKPGQSTAPHPLQHTWSAGSDDNEAALDLADQLDDEQTAEFWRAYYTRRKAFEQASRSENARFVAQGSR